MTDRLYKSTSSNKNILKKKNIKNKNKNRRFLTINALAITVKHFVILTALLDTIVAGGTLTQVCTNVRLQPSLRVSYFLEFLTHTSIRTIDVTSGL